jgi:SSS family solute:Na+ symporter
MHGQPSGLQPLDWALVGLYLSTTIGMGLYASRKQESMSEYFVGSGNMNPLLVGVSLFATLLSTITYLSLPGEAAGKGPVFLVSLLALPLVYWIVAWGILPVYMQYRVTSAYELLERRLGLSVRLLGAGMFLALRLVWMTLLIYLAAKAMTVIIGLQPKWVPAMVAVIGLTSVAYTSMGGLRAVVVTDFMQTVLLFGGALLVIGQVTIDMGGFHWFPHRWQPTWDVQPLFSFDPRTRVTMVGVILSVLTWYVCTLGSDQTTIQRFMATRDVQAAKRALATQLGVSVIVQATLFVVGFALLGYFLVHPQELPAGADLKASADDLFPRYISYHLPVGVSGLVVAGMFAAAMSSIDSGVNSITAVMFTDFADRLGWIPDNERTRVRAARLLALGIGVIVVAGSSLMRFVEGNITAVTSKTSNLLTTPIFGLFFLAFFVPRATPLGVWMGAVFGTATAAAIAFSGPLVVLLNSWFGVDPAWFGVQLVSMTDPVTGRQYWMADDPVSFQWIGPVAFLVNITVGTLVSYALPRTQPTSV